MRMSSADFKLLRRAAFGFIPRGSDPMQMIRRRREQAVGVRAVWAGGSPLDMAAENHVIEVRRDRIADEHLPEAVKIHSPWIGRALHDRFENLFDRMIA